MNSRDNETLIVLAGVAVLAVSLILPMMQRIASEHDVHEVAVRAIEVKDKLLSSTDSAKPLRVRVTEIVDGLSPDAALAEAEMRSDRAVAPAAVDAVARPEEEALPSAVEAAVAPPAALANAKTVAEPPATTQRKALEPEQVVEARPREPIAPRDGSGAPAVERSGAAWIWDQ